MPTMDDLRLEVAHAQQADHIRSAHRSLERLEVEQDRLAVGWPSAAVLHRRGVLVVAVRQARERIAQLEAEQAVERMVGLDPLLDAPAPSRRRPGLPAWHLGPDPWDSPRPRPSATASAPGSARGAAARPAARRADPPPRRTGQRGQR